MRAVLCVLALALNTGLGLAPAALAQQAFLQREMLL